jgi:mono/diheme cytochrome c family protein
VEVSSAFVRLKFRALAVAVALAAISGPSVAQDSGKSGVAAAPAASGDAAKLDKGRGIFSDYGCANCHSLADAGATGHVGPSLDGNANLTQEFVVERVTNGQGMMPSFGGQLSADEINAVAAYIVKVATK